MVLVIYSLIAPIASIVVSADSQLVYYLAWEVVYSVGRPWWYDSYWDKHKQPTRRRFQLPRRQVWVWIMIFVLSLVLAAGRTSFQPNAVAWLIGFIYYVCRILMFVVLARAILSWFTLSRYNVLVALLDDITEPILSPLRQVIPRLGMFDITPMVAIAILYFIPFIITRLVS